MIKLRHILPSALLAVTLFFLFGAATTFAASVYSCDQSTATVGVAQSYEIEYTVDTSDETWADGDTLQVQIPAGFSQWNALPGNDDDDDETDEEPIDEEETTEEETPSGNDDDDDDDDDTTDEIIELDDIEDHWAKDEIEYMVETGIVEGDPSGNFRPDDKLNRAEAATLIYRSIDYSAEPDALEEDPFDDVDKDQWYAGYVAELLELELISGNPDGTFRPSEPINRAEFLTMAMNLYEFFYGEVEDVEITDAYADLNTEAWYAQTVSNAAALDFVEGSACGSKTCFKASSKITRAEATTILYRMFAIALASH